MAWQRLLGRMCWLCRDEALAVPWNAERPPSAERCRGIHAEFPNPLLCALNRTLEHGRG